MFHPKTIQSSLKPLFYCTKLLGLSPFSINDNRYENSLLNVLYSLCLMLAIGGYSFVSINYKAHHAAIITRITNAMHIHLCILSMCTGLLFGCIRRKKIVEVINSLSEIDKKLKAFNSNINLEQTYKNTSVYLTIALFFVSLYIMSMIFLDVVAFSKTPDVIGIGELVAYNAPIMTIFVEFQFCILILLLRQRFAWINDKMTQVGKYISANISRDKYEISTTKVNGPMNHKKLIKIVQAKALSTLGQISITHYELCNISKRLNTAYSCQILLIVIQGFMSIIAMSFYLAKYIFSKEDYAFRLDYRIYFGPTLIFYVVAVTALTVVCSSASKQAQKTGVLLHRVVPVYLCINDGYLDLEVACFSLQLLHQNVSFTACRMFVIDETLLMSIVGAATTYLVIVLQFEIGVDMGTSNSTLANLTTLIN